MKKCKSTKHKYRQLLDSAGRPVVFKERKEGIIIWCVVFFCTKCLDIAEVKTDYRL